MDSALQLVGMVMQPADRVGANGSEAADSSSRIRPSLARRLGPGRPTVTSNPKQAQGSSTLTSHMGGLLHCSVVPVGRRRTGGERWLRSTRNGRRRGWTRKKKRSSKLVNCARWAGELFSGPRRWRGRVLALRPCSGDWPVRVWAQGSRARRAEREADPPLPTSLLHHARARRIRRVGVHGGAVLRRAGGCGLPVCPGTRRRGRAACGPPAGAA